ncbi:MAG TPA: thioesterase [Deltaproteobacteria bacterium]|nr:thioesterase [Deltaproteobacteria bacterium]
MTETPARKDDSNIYRRPFHVRYSETGSNGFIKPVKVFDYCQDAAMEHADKLGVSSVHLKARDLAWFVVRYRVRLFALPRWNQGLILQTWRYPQRGLYEIRCYELRDDEERLLMQGRSALVIIDTRRKRPVRLRHALPAEQLTAVPDEGDTFADLPAVTHPEFEQLFSIRKQDLDFNGHVNNTVFIGWALENMPGSESLMPSEVEVNYLSDIEFGRTVMAQGQSLAHETGPAFLYRIADTRDNRETTRMRIAWKPLQ